MEPKKTVTCFVAGRSGGHLIPALTLAQQLKQTQKDLRVLFFSANTALDQQIAGSSDVVDWHVPLKLDNVPLRKPWLLPAFCWRFAAAFFTARTHLKKHRPASVLSTGGYISIPVFFAARTLKIPTDLFELNVIPGKTTTFLSKMARTIYVCFEQTKKYVPAQKCQMAPYPIRYTVPSDLTAAREQALEQFHFSPEKKTILVLGGSQGSVFLNNAIKHWATTHHAATKNLQIIHQTGARDHNRWHEIYKHAHMKAHIVDFSDDMPRFYAAADLVICRSGAGSLFETLFFQKPCITMPLETVENNHQLDNARAMTESYPHLFSVIRQQEIEKSCDVLAREIERKLRS